jgi:hypothetical protein
MLALNDAEYDAVMAFTGGRRMVMALRRRACLKQSHNE